MSCCHAFTFVYYIAIFVRFFQLLSPRDSCKPPKDVGSSLLPPWWLQELLLDTCSCSRQGKGERGEGGGRVTGCSCLRIETHHRLQSCCQGQVHAKWCFKCLFSSCNCRMLCCHWYLTSGLERQSRTRKSLLQSCFDFGHSVWFRRMNSDICFVVKAIWSNPKLGRL